MDFRKISIIITIVIISTSSFAQYQINIQAKVLDKTTDQPLPYVNVDFKNKRIKAITNGEGKFILLYDEDSIRNDDVVQFSAFGYQVTQATVSAMHKLLKNTDKIYLVPESFDSIDDSIDQNTSKTNSRMVQAHIKGKVTTSNVPLEGVSVKVKNTLVETVTDVDGKYDIAAREDDLLVFDFLGMKPREFLVGKHQTIDIELDTEATILDEVELFREKTKEENMINLGLSGKKSFDAVGTSINIITAKDIAPHYITIGELLEGRFAALNHSREGSISNSQGRIYDIDGMIFQDKNLPAIHPQNIETVTVLTSLAATTLYGTLGRGGVIIIRTKTFSVLKEEVEQASALATGNDYVEDVDVPEYEKRPSSRISAIQEAKTFQEAKVKYESMLLKSKGQDIGLSLGAAEYFQQWDKKYAEGIYDHLELISKDNPSALRSLAFSYDELGRSEDAQLVYQRVAVIRPQDAQSHRDLAHIYTANGYLDQALDIYIRMLENSMAGVDFSGVRSSMAEELMHLIAIQGKDLNLSRIPKEYISPDFKQDARLVFEWNDPSAEFELQFVNPQKKFYKWSHTKFENADRMLDELKNGYMTESYIIDDEEPGEWIINIEALNEEPSINPNYLKYTLYKNYGRPNETKTVRVINLQTLDKKVTLDKFRYK